MTRKARAIGWLAIVCLLGAGARAEEERVHFARDIRPILSNKCFLCHGVDEEGRKGGLRLDTEEGAKGEADSGGRAVVPGDLGESELIARILSDDPAGRMPPESSGKSLTPAEIDLLKRWIAQGGDYAAHWAFVPPEASEPPAVRGEGWARGEIDRFIKARLEAEGLEPNPEAGRETLIRRLSLDLIGLPPTPEEVDAFVADDRPEAYDELVEKLLASPHHGERWGRLWLDAARYADSDGFEKDKPRQAWAYRDWVIKSLNEDLPYDQFIARQIAGDLLPGATQDDIVATGFLRNSMINEEGGVDPEQFRMEAMFDRMDAVGKAMLGLTIQCAQCHSHKYDPITHEDYYKMFAALNNSDEASVAVYSPAEQQARAALFGRIEEIEGELRHRHPGWPEKMAAWEAKASENLPTWEVVRPELDTSGGQKHYLLDDGSILAAGYAPTQHTTEFPGRVAGPRKITAARLELLNDPNLPLGGPGRSVEGLFGLTEFKVEVEGVGEVKVVKATADVDPAEAPLKAYYDDRSGKKRVTGPVAYAIDGKNETAWTTDIGPGRSNVPRKAVFVFEKPVEIPEAGAVVTFKLAQNHGGWNSDDNQNYNLGRFRFSVTDATDPVADPLPPRVREILARPAAERTEGQMREVFTCYRATVPEWAAENDEIERLWKGHPRGASQLVLAEKATPRVSRMLERGDFLKPGKEVSFGVPAALNPLPGGCESDPPRLQFAKWLSDEKAPTTARAVVNRVWQAYFGTGLLETSEDLGSQAPAPSHPELLDRLAADFMADGWSLKRLHRRIVGSATYRQSSKATPEKLAADPNNRLLARGARTRVDAEIVRDIALAASGLLNREVGGPSVHPPAPAFLFQPPASYGPKVWEEAKGPGRYRRAMYTFRYRSVPYPMLQAFDAPNGDAACVRRTRSNTPLQALTTLNEPMFLECARALALLALERGGSTDRERLVFAFRRCVGRGPSDAELGVLGDFLARQAERYGSAGAEPWSLVAEDPENPPALPDGVSPARMAAWTAFSRVLLNLDETITKE